MCFAFSYSSSSQLTQSDCIPPVQLSLEDILSACPSFVLHSPRTEPRGITGPYSVVTSAIVDRPCVSTRALRTRTERDRAGGEQQDVGQGQDGVEISRQWWLGGNVLNQRDTDTHSSLANLVYLVSFIFHSLLTLLTHYV